MCSGERPGGHHELWIPDPPESRGPEADYRMWQEAESYIEHLMNVSDGLPNEGITVALCDCYNRCIEERRRAGDLMALHHKWSLRRIGGVEEPESAVRV
ncbi:MAG: hypothetical protein AVDCRST_MAG58-2011 [uncultured Rubrobacteraceae bacterium]|uniref:Uncharacterized protein n=1 Tax=uncultured Rubrobacteraceae bacterium TaxID=349277 RepID=A0A6J4QYI3_9ACTN|nr:MAG: hypothetical protein AVDCRST_MAG58-2011 [uncultured Rubrobacteraceae bacterium]